MNDSVASGSVLIPVLMKEIRFKTSRSGGKGGQNVNKVETRVELVFDIAASDVLTLEEKNHLYERLNSRIDKSGTLRIVSSSSRSQLENKEKAKEKFSTLIEKAFRPVKKRKKTKPTKAAGEKRIRAKKVRSEVKKSRRWKEE